MNISKGNSSSKVSKNTVRSKLVIDESNMGKELGVKTTIKKFDKFEHSPFVNDLYEVVYKKHGKKRVTKFITQNKQLLDNDTGNLEDIHLITGKRNYVDERTFVKVYQESMRTIFGLSGNAVKLLMYAASLLEKNSLAVDLYTESICDILKVSQDTFYRNLKELISLNIFARSTRIYRFFINPVFIFNGNAITVINQYVNIDAKRIDRENALQAKLEQERSFGGLIDKWARQIAQKDGDGFYPPDEDMDQETDNDIPEIDQFPVHQNSPYIMDDDQIENDY